MGRSVMIVVMAAAALAWLAACSPPALPASSSPAGLSNTVSPPPEPAQKPDSPAPLKPMARGKPDPSLIVEAYNPEKACHGTTLLPLNYDLNNPRIVELNMLGEIIWEYTVPADLRPPHGRGLNPGFDVELLPNGHILFVSPGKGVYEIDRKGNVIWAYLDIKVSHDADRLPNGNTLVVCGNNDQMNDAQVREVNPKGEIVWSWYARDYFNKSPYRDVSLQGWTHTNAAQRLASGNTLISLRNFNIVAEVDPKGTVTSIIGEGIFDHQHDPVMLPGGNLLVAVHNSLDENRGRPQRAIEIDPKTNTILWQFGKLEPSAWPLRDANRLPNGNTLITGSTRIVEVTADGNIVWQLAMQGITMSGQTDRSERGFYKAERIQE